jgi:hypothetical protein
MSSFRKCGTCQAERHSRSLRAFMVGKVRSDKFLATFPWQTKTISFLPGFLTTSSHHFGGSFIGSRWPFGSPPANPLLEGASVRGYSTPGVHICKNQSGYVYTASSALPVMFLHPRSSKILSHVVSVDPKNASWILLIHNFVFGSTFS